jgi:hypothetical protein
MKMVACAELGATEATIKENTASAILRVFTYVPMFVLSHVVGITLRQSPRAGRAELRRP